MNATRTAAIARKEFLHILRDRRSLALALAVPLVMLLLFGYALSLDVDRVPTYVHDDDGTPESRDLIADFQGSRYFEVKGFEDSAAALQRHIDRDHALLGMVIPRGFARSLHRGQVADVQFLLDGSDSNTASIALGYAEATVQAFAAGTRARAQNVRFGAEVKRPVETRVRVWYNSSLRSRNYIVPGLIAVILMIISAMLTSLTIAREWETGTMEQLLSTPLRPAELVLGKLSAYFAIGLTDMLIAVLIGVFLFGVPLRGNPLFLLLTGCVFLFGALCWGLFLSAAMRNQMMAYQAGMVTSFLPAFLLSGFVYAIENMPHVVQAVTYIFPSRYFISILKGVFLKGVGIEVLAVELAFLVVYGVVIFALTTKKVRRKLA